MELSREQLEMELMRLLNGVGVGGNILAHDQALRQSRDEWKASDEAMRGVYGRCNTELELKKAELAEVYKERDEYKAKYNELRESFGAGLIRHDVAVDLGKSIANEYEAMQQQLAQAAARVAELTAVNDQNCARVFGMSIRDVRALQQRVAELEQAENDRVNMGMVLGGMASGAIEAERRENAVLKQRVASLEVALRRLWATKKYEWSNDGGTKYQLSFYGNPNDIEHALEGT